MQRGTERALDTVVWPERLWMTVKLDRLHRHSTRMVAGKRNVFAVMPILRYNDQVKSGRNSLIRVKVTRSRPLR